MPETTKSAEMSSRPTRMSIDRLCLRVDEDESDAAVLHAAVLPGVVGGLLHQHVARAQANLAAGQQHVDLALDHRRIVDTARAVHLALRPGREIHHAEDGDRKSTRLNSSHVALSR